jgi:hypothetical protein
MFKSEIVAAVPTTFANENSLSKLNPLPSPKMLASRPPTEEKTPELASTAQSRIAPTMVEIAKAIETKKPTFTADITSIERSFRRTCFTGSFGALLRLNSFAIRLSFNID